MRLVMSSVDSRLVPSGARTATANSDSSSTGMKFFFTTTASGTLDRKISAAVTTTAFRCASAQSSSRA